MHEYYIWSSLCWNHGLFPFPVLTRTDNQQILHIFIFFYTLLLFALICQSFNWSSCAVHFLAIFLVLEKVFAISQHKKSQIVIIKGNWRKGQKYYSGRDILIKPFLSLLLLYDLFWSDILVKDILFSVFYRARLFRSAPMFSLGCSPLALDRQPALTKIEFKRSKNVLQIVITWMQRGNLGYVKIVVSI